MTATEALQLASSKLLAGRLCVLCGKPTGAGRRMYCKPCAAIAQEQKRAAAHAEKHCAFCDVPLPPGRHEYCSDGCREKATYLRRLRRSWETEKQQRGVGVRGQAAE
jgi:predicted nucleic acid-binding Zn ribbon protein